LNYVEWHSVLEEVAVGVLEEADAQLSHGELRGPDMEQSTAIRQAFTDQPIPFAAAGFGAISAEVEASTAERDHGLTRGPMFPVFGQSIRQSWHDGISRACDAKR
jgi:hypothetical protein